MAVIRLKKKHLLIFPVIFLFLAGIGLGRLLPAFQKETPDSIVLDQDPRSLFVAEIYDLIQENYWEKITDEKLSALFKLASEKLTESPQTLETKNKEGVLKLISGIIENKTDEEKREFCTQTTDIVLANLEPFGRSRLYTTQKEQTLKNRVENIDPDTDQYEVLGVEKNADQEEIDDTYQQVKEDLEIDDSLEAQQKLQEIKKAHDTLKDEESRQTYDRSGVETSISYKLVQEKILHIHIKQFTPTTFEELQNITQKIDEEADPDTLIFDLRDNVGGAIDGLPYFLGPFIGQDQYAYQFYHQGEKEDFKTQTGWLPGLVRYKKVVILVNENTQSSAEVMAAVLKKYNVGVVLGTSTRGWGTVERVFPLDSQLHPDEKYSVFLVHSLTLRDDNQPIQDKGVDPLISINNPDWEDLLNVYFNDPNLISAIKEIWER